VLAVFDRVIFYQAKPEIGWLPKTDERLIPISPTLQQILLEQYAHRRSAEWVFANQMGHRDGHMLEKLKKSLKSVTQGVLARARQPKALKAGDLQEEEGELAEREGFGLSGIP
jgi:hypothetical protein